MERTTSPRLHRTPDGGLGGLVRGPPLLVDNGESLLVRSIDDADALAVNETGVTVATEICQIVWLLKWLKISEIRASIDALRIFEIGKNFGVRESPWKMAC